MSHALQRIWGLVLRYLYLYRRNVARLGDVVFWPVMELVVWGFMTQYLQQLDAPKAAVYLLGGVILWDLLYRSQMAISLAFTEEIWARNIANIFISPVSLPEYVAATAVVGVLRGLVGFLLLALLSIALYAFNIFALGPALVPCMLILMLFGWAIGMVTMGLILRFGKAAEALVWGVPFLFQPLVAVFYPVSILPTPLQYVARAIPATHAFEAMRHTLSTGAPLWPTLTTALLLNIVWLAGAAAFLGFMLDRMRRTGYLGKLGME